jgi:hypothetical protein
VRCECACRCLCLVSCVWATLLTTTTNRAQFVEMTLELKYDDWGSSKPASKKSLSRTPSLHEPADGPSDANATREVDSSAPNTSERLRKRVATLPLECQEPKLLVDASLQLCVGVSLWQGGTTNVVAASKSVGAGFSRSKRSGHENAHVNNRPTTRPTKRKALPPAVVAKREKKTAPPVVARNADDDDDDDQMSVLAFLAADSLMTLTASQPSPPDDSVLDEAPVVVVARARRQPPTQQLARAKAIGASAQHSDSARAIALTIENARRKSRAGRAQFSSGKATRAAKLALAMSSSTPVPVSHADIVAGTAAVPATTGDAAAAGDGSALPVPQQKSARDALRRLRTPPPPPPPTLERSRGAAVSESTALAGMSCLLLGYARAYARAVSRSCAAISVAVASNCKSTLCCAAAHISKR